MKMILIFSIFTLLDFFTYHSLKLYVKNKIILKLYFGLNISVLVLAILSFLFNFYKYSEISEYYTMTFLFIFYTPKGFFLLIVFFEYVYFFLKKVFFYITKTKKKVSICRSILLNKISFILYCVFILYLLYGFFIGRTDYRVERKTLYFKDLPINFEGLKIVQISDLHLGSFGGEKNIDKIVNLVNLQNPDIIVFTGDIVNQTSKELTDIYIQNIKKLRSKMGKFAIFGNHDYGDYFIWSNKKDSLDNIDNIKTFYKQTGFTLLDNKNVSFKRDSSILYLLGVENYGKKMQHGDIEKADFLLPKDGFKILLSHDPFHFDKIIKKYYSKIDLTLSGHTHGGQLGIKLFNRYFSLMNLWKSKTVGLYEENGKKLYINRGLGNSSVILLRSGMSPEISLFVLVKLN